MASSSPRIAFVAGMFNEPLVTAMLAGARAEAEGGGATVVRVAQVPGCYEIPLVAKRVIERDDVDLLVVLGYIERGETLHGEIMGHVVHRALMDLSLATGKPVGLGIIGPGATPAQAETRKDAYARAAVKAALASLVELRKT
jgi:6,7-dimethyl-8-ribityllumazine synthase